MKSTALIPDSGLPSDYPDDDSPLAGEIQPPRRDANGVEIVSASAVQTHALLFREALKEAKRRNDDVADRKFNRDKWRERRQWRWRAIKERRWMRIAFQRCAPQGPRQ
jgi:hypothetical protein